MTLRHPAWGRILLLFRSQNGPQTDWLRRYIPVLRRNHFSERTAGLGKQLDCFAVLAMTGDSFVAVLAMTV